MKCSDIKAIFVCVIAVLLIPPLLNVVLTYPSPFEISIVEDGAPAIWLTFWGSYAAAVASFVMAYVAYAQNKEIRNQNKATVDYQMVLKQYEELEKFELEVERLISYSAFEIICQYGKTESNESPSFLKALNEHKMELNRVSSLSIKLLKDLPEESSQFKQKISTLYLEVIRLSNILLNIDDITFDSDYKKYIVEFPLENGGMDKYDKFLRYAKKILGENGVNELHEVGFQCLRTEWDNVITKMSNI